MAPPKKPESYGRSGRAADLGVFKGSLMGVRTNLTPKRISERDCTKDIGFKAFLKVFRKQNFGLKRAKLMEKAKCRWRNLASFKKKEFRMKVSFENGTSLVSCSKLINQSICRQSSKWERKQNLLMMPGKVLFLIICNLSNSSR